MKWLLLILLVSCGKHETPPRLDFGDFDGDQILNYMEATEQDKYIANFERLGIIRGSISILNSYQGQYQFSNQESDSSYAVELITITQNDLPPSRYFLEWTDLKIRKNSNATYLNQASYTLEINFESTDINPHELYLADRNERIKLGDWKPTMRITLSGDTLQRLITGSAKLSLKRNISQLIPNHMPLEESLNKKTYRVHVFDGMKSNVFFISTELSFEKFKQLNNIQDTEIYTEEDIFFSEDIKTPFWFERKFANGDYVLVYASPNQLKESLLKRFHKSQNIIQRINGTPAIPLTLTNSKGRVYLKIKGIQRHRQFQEVEVKKVYPIVLPGNGISARICHHKVRQVASEINLPVNLSEIMEAININQSEIIRTAEYHRPEGIFWGIKLHSPENGLNLNLLPLPNTDYVITGEYAPSCRGRTLVPAQNTSIESEFTLEIESYVEK